tara:strand:- start:768 stop:1628 length:861 start_codon:yes stop_codon:yes gene_type:complete
MKQEPHKHVIFYIFAGREKFMSILLKYVNVLLNRGIISEVHIWDYTRTKQDKKYVYGVCNSNDGYTLKIPTKNEKNWDESYHYYRDTLRESDKVIKCDDDIVYIDIESFGDWVNCIEDGKFYYPNIVNNDVCAYLQQKIGVHNLFDYDVDYDTFKNKKTSTPLTGWGKFAWFRSSKKANKIHKLFLKNKDKFILKKIPYETYNSRISINMFGCTGQTFKTFLPHETLGRNDEAIVSARCGAGNILNLNTTIVHFAFAPQKKLENDNELLYRYVELSIKQTKGMNER